jgi:hypothetical protein
MVRIVTDLSEVIIDTTLIRRRCAMLLSEIFLTELSCPCAQAPLEASGGKSEGVGGSR